MANPMSSQRYRRRSLAAPITVLLPVTVMIVLSQEVPVLPHDEASLELEAEELLSTNSAVVVQPRVEIVDGRLLYYPGYAALRASTSGVLMKSQYRAPVEAELHVLLLRRYLSGLGGDYSQFWKPYLDEAILEIRKMLHDLEANPDHIGQERSQFFAERKALIDSAFAKAGVMYAVQHRLRFDPSNELRAKLLRITFIGEPVGAEIQIVDGLLYRTAGATLDERLWLDVSSGNAVDLLAGDWEIKRRLAPTQPWQYGLESITSSGKYTVRVKQRPE
jgi:hypothetical protein